MERLPLDNVPVETRVIGGFLGAGKTTFILEHLKRPGGRTAVLVNEFGRLGIDGDLIRLKGGAEVVEMPGGCICCSQREGLLQSVRRVVREFRPTLLLIEPSGVAELSELLQALSDPSLAGVIRIGAAITVVDAETFLEFSEPELFGPFFLDQVTSADLILVNKSDLVPPETLGAIEERIGLFNPGALVLRTEFCRLEGELPDNFTRPAAPGRPRAALDLDCMSVPVRRTFPQSDLPRLLAEIERGRFGRIIRGKGFLQADDGEWLSLQFVSGQVAVERLWARVAPRLTLIGFDLQPLELDLFLSEIG